MKQQMKAVYTACYAGLLVCLVITALVIIAMRLGAFDNKTAFLLLIGVAVSSGTVVFVGFLMLFSVGKGGSN